MTFYFYDLETSGVNPRWSRIMQFGGQRTGLNLKPLGKPDNFLVKLSEDVLPDPEAVLVHGITPQRTIAEGITEAEAVKYLVNQVFIPDTIAVGYNNIRFDDEFIRHLFWRNFTDAYEWQWKDHRSKWDILDLARMTRALRPEGIKWPFGPDGKPSNRLGLLAAINNLEHIDAHDALSDVKAALSLARLIRNKQTKLFDYLLQVRDKTRIGALVGKGEPFIYTSGRYPSEFSKTSAVILLAPHPERDAGLVYDLRVDPDEFTGLTPAQLAALWQLRGPDAPYFPVKKMAYNRCPAVAPLSVLDDESASRLSIDRSVVSQNLKKLRAAKGFDEKMLKALERIEPKRQPELIINEQTVDAQLYDGFVDGPDKTKMAVVRAADASALAGLELDFEDERLKALLPLYKARNYPQVLAPDEKLWWEEYKLRKLVEGGPASAVNRYLDRVGELINQKQISVDQKNLLSELHSYGESRLASE